MSENHFVERILTKQGVWSGDVRGGAPLLLPVTRVLKVTANRVHRHHSRMSGLRLVIEWF